MQLQRVQSLLCIEKTSEEDFMHPLPDVLARIVMRSAGQRVKRGPNQICVPLVNAHCAADFCMNAATVSPVLQVRC